MQWHILERSDSHAIITKIIDGDDSGLFTPATSEVKCLDIPFYSEFKLYRITNYASMPSFSFDYLGNEEIFHRLDGTPDPIYAVNISDTVQLNAQNVLLYLDFFLTNVQAEDGDIYLVTNTQKLPFFNTMPADQQDMLETKIINPEISYEFNLHAFVINATLYFAGVMMNAVIQIEETGEVSVIDQTMLMTTDYHPIQETAYQTQRR